jgi:hypothetical protein
MKEYQKKLIEEKKRKETLLNSNLGEYIDEIMKRVGNKRVEVKIRKPNGEEIWFKPSEEKTQPFVINNEEIY